VDCVHFASKEEIIQVVGNGWNKAKWRRSDNKEYNNIKSVDHLNFASKEGTGLFTFCI